MAGDYHIEDIYGGGYSAMDPNKGELFTGYRIPAGQIGLATDPRTANVVSDVSSKLQSGAKQIEVATINPADFDSIPFTHLKEVNRVAKLAGADISVHGIIAEPSGIGQQGYSNLAREETERQMLSSVLRAHEMSPDGNVPVTFHTSAGWPSAEYRPVVDEKGKKTFEKWKIPVINQETNQVNQIVEAETRFMPGRTAEELKKGVHTSAMERIEDMNGTQWSDSLNQLIAVKDRVDRTLSETAPLATEIYRLSEAGKIVSAESLTPEQRGVLSKYQNAGEEVHDMRRHLVNLFERAYKYGTPEEKENLGKMSEQFGKDMNKIEKPWDFQGQANLMQDFMEKLRGFNPQVFKPLEDFAVDKSAETFGNVAYGAYEKFHEKAPIVSIENPPVGMGLSRAEDLQNLVKASRKQFVKRAVEDGLSEREAQKQAEKLIGVTWDVGHINMIRKQGFGEEDVIKESEKVAPLIKHVHLSDNFGFEHTELPMGMGNVPIKEIMQKLGQKGFEAKKVIEAGQWWQHFKTPPFQETLEAFGSPLYSMKMAPSWNQAVGPVGYFGGYGSMLPQINYETMGAGFSMLPSELGGQRGGGRGGRMSGRPME